MFVLDTDHLSELVKQSPSGARLAKLLETCDETVVTSIISFEEMLRGWLAKIHSDSIPRNQIGAYQKLSDILDSFQDWAVLGWDQESVNVFDELVSHRLGVKTMDLKIASITIRQEATLLSRNLKDFGRVPGLNVEDWLS